MRRRLSTCLIATTLLVLGCAPSTGDGDETNTAPRIDALTADTTELAISGTTELRVEAFDAEGDPLTISWDATGGFFVLPDFDPRTANLVAPSTPGTRGAVTVTVTDPSGASSEATLDVTTTANQAPHIQSLDLSPDAALEPGGEATLSARVTDADGDTVELTWFIAEPWRVTPSSDTPNTATLHAPDRFSDTESVTLFATDSAGGRTSTALDVRTRPNAPPRADGITVEGGLSQLEPNATAALHLTASDPDGHTLAVDWSADDSTWTLTPDPSNATSATLTAPDASGAEITVTATVTDGFGGSATATRLLSTTTPSGPIIRAFTANPSAVARGESLTLTVDAIDPDGEPLRYFFKGPFGWSIDSDGSATATVTAPTQPDQLASIQVTVIDAENLSARASVDVSTQPNTPPTIDSLTLDVDPVAPFGTANVSISTSDADGDAVTVRWSVQPSTWAIFNATNTSAQLLASTQRADSATVIAIASDGLSETRAELTVSTTETCPEDTATAGDVCVTCDQTVIIRDHPIIQYRLDEVSGDAYDDSGHRRDAIYGSGVTRAVGSPVHDDLAGAGFDGSDDAHLSFSPFALFPPDALSLELWLRTSNRDPARTAISYITPSRRELVLTNPTNLTVTLAGESFSTGLDVADGAWHFVIVTWRSIDGVAHVYLDGQDAGSTTLTPGALIGSDGAYVIGADQSAPGQVLSGSAWHGAIDEPAIYKDLLTPSEQLQHLAALTCNEQCDGTDTDGDGRIDEGFLGSAPACPASSCAAIQDADADIGDGNYWIGASLEPCVY